ncbi:MAG: hypothetical protein ABIA59_11955 [Candidatus Latescibacterota bacterium]
MNKTIFIVTISAMILVSAGYCQACHCGYFNTPLEEFNAVDAVFKGLVLDISMCDELDMRDVTILVTGYWKGVSAETVHVFTGTWDGDCGFAFELCEEYLIYALDLIHEGCQGATTGLCSRTTLLWNAEEDLAVLGEPLTVPNRSVTWGEVKSHYKPE